MTIKERPPMPGFWVDYRNKLVHKLGRSLKAGEIQVVMKCYINDEKLEDCVKELRYKELM